MWSPNLCAALMLAGGVIALLLVFDALDAVSRQRPFESLRMSGLEEPRRLDWRAWPHHRVGGLK